MSILDEPDTIFASAKECGVILKSLQETFGPDAFDIKKGDSGLWFMTSRVPELKGMLIAACTVEACLREAPITIMQMLWVTMQQKAAAE